MDTSNVHIQLLLKQQVTAVQPAPSTTYSAASQSCLTVHVEQKLGSLNYTVRETCHLK
jgi:hypothetical protein